MSNTNEIMAKIKEYGRRRYEQGVEDGRKLADAEARRHDKSIQEAVHLAYEQGKREAEAEAAKSEERFEEDINRLKDYLLEERNRKSIWR